jgi:hypothetical protein
MYDISRQFSDDSWIVMNFQVYVFMTYVRDHTTKIHIVNQFLNIFFLCSFKDIRITAMYEMSDESLPLLKLLMLLN